MLPQPQQSTPIVGTTIKDRTALTLVEVVVSTLIVGVMTVAALNALGAATRSGMSARNRAIAQGMADQLMAETLAVAYSDPDGAADFGLESGEAAPRINFDDVDDFNGWNCQPPQYSDGTVMADRDDFRQRVTVQRAVPTNVVQAPSGSTDSGAKRIVVTIEYEGTELAEQIVVRTDTD